MGHEAIMMSFVSPASDYASVLRSVIARIEIGWGTLTAASVQLIEGGTVLSQYAEESRAQNAGLADSAAGITHALDEVDRAQANLAAAIGHLVAYLAAIGFLVDRASASSRTLDADAVAERRRALPADIPRANTGRKTYGRWVRSDGTEGTMISGDDAAQVLARGYLDDFGMGYLAISSHAEMKLAAIVRQAHDRDGERGHATIVINYIPCLGSRSCPVFLPKILPVGCSVTVYGADGYYARFEGERR